MVSGTDGMLRSMMAMDAIAVLATVLEADEASRRKAK